MATDGTPSPTSLTPDAALSEREVAAGFVPSHGISINLPSSAHESGEHHYRHPVRHVSAPAYQSPLRHHRRAPSRSKGVKETLDARSHYGSSDDDGGAVHRINQYIIKQEIGRGSFGAVHLAVDQYGHEYAVKEFSKSRLRKRAQSNLLRKPNQSRRPGQLSAGGGFNSPLHRHTSSDKLNGANNSLELIKEEIAIMKKLDHHNLVSLIEVLDDPQEDSLYMILEMCKKGVAMHVGLDDRAEPYDDEQCRCWFRDMILGIEYLHAQGIIHRDIKPDNCLITHDDVLKIVDFGVSEMFEKESDMHTTKSAGSPAFMPPELCVVKHGPVSGKAADIWSMGVTLYCLRYGRIPFEKSGMLDLYEAIKNDELLLENEQDENFADLMFKLLEKDPEKRITMAQLRTHPWVTRGGTDPMMPAEDNCAALVEPPTDAEMNEAITGNMAHLMVVMKAVKRFKKLIYRKRPQFMEGLFGRESRLSTPPSAVHRSSRSVDTSDRQPIDSALATEGVHRPMEDEILKAPDLSRLGFQELQTPPSPLDSAGADGRSLASNSSHPLAAQPLSSSDDHLDRPYLEHKASTFPMDERGKGQAHDPLEDRIFLNIGAGGEVDGADDGDNYFVCESPSGADEDIYEAAYQKELERILNDRDNASVVLVRRVEHIERLRIHPNVLASSINHAIDFAGTTASRAHQRARTSRLASFARDKRDRARANVNERIEQRAADRAYDDVQNPIAPALMVNDEAASSPLPSPGITTIPSGLATPPSRSRTPNSERRLRDAAKFQAGQTLKGVARRLNEKASRLEARSSSGSGGGAVSPYPET
ncbi:putative serine/threonine-protein kinase, active [Septoria linicola]|nr:putative serine/threonine-protein kinase, active [Septoria linicola]